MTNYFVVSYNSIDDFPLLRNPRRSDRSKKGAKLSFSALIRTVFLIGDMEKGPGTHSSEAL